MPFKAVLNQLLEDIPGAQGVVIVDWEGEAVDYVSCLDDYDLKLIGAHSGIILSLLKKVQRSHDESVLRELCWRCENGQILTVPLSDNYLLVVQLAETVLSAQAANRLHRCAEMLHEEFNC